MNDLKANVGIFDGLVRAFATGLVLKKVQKSTHPFVVAHHSSAT